MSLSNGTLVSGRLGDARDGGGGGGPHVRYPSQIILLYMAAILQSGCGYYIPMTAIVLWQAVGVGAFVMGLVYLQFMYSSYFFFDGPVSMEMARITASYVVHDKCKGGGQFGSKCYPSEAQYFASFFFMLFTHFTVYKSWSESAWRAIVLTLAFFLYIGSIAWTEGTDSRLVVVAAVIGAVIGITKVLFFDSVLCPLCMALCNVRLQCLFESREHETLPTSSQRRDS